jgi:hypothetical protein
MMLRRNKYFNFGGKMIIIQGYRNYCKETTLDITVNLGLLDTSDLTEF